MNVIRCSDKTYALISDYATERHIPLSKAVDEMVSGQLSKDMELPSERVREVVREEMALPVEAIREVVREELDRVLGEPADFVDDDDIEEEEPLELETAQLLPQEVETSAEVQEEDAEASEPEQEELKIGFWNLLGEESKE